MVTEDSLWWNTTLAPAARLKKESYRTDMALAELRLLFTPFLGHRWSPYLYAGGGVDFYDVADLTARRGPASGKGTTGMIPLGVGLRCALSERWTLEGATGYTFTFSDQIDELVEPRYPTRYQDAGRKDNFLAATLGLVYQIPGGAKKPVQRAVAPPVPAPVAPAAQDEAALAKQKAEQEAKEKAEAEARLKAEEDARTREAGVEQAQGFAPVYFDYDSYGIRDDQRTRLLEYADQLKARPGSTATLAGHCDERGTMEYNLALGHKRASSVREYLVRAGVPAERLRTVSYGKERPAVPGHNESAWSQNRRVEVQMVP
jgi:peptidoglycan-associated lipoprotein